MSECAARMGAALLLIWILSLLMQICEGQAQTEAHHTYATEISR